MRELLESDSSPGGGNGKPAIPKRPKRGGGKDAAHKRQIVPKTAKDRLVESRIGVLQPPSGSGGRSESEMTRSIPDDHYRSLDAGSPPHPRPEKDCTPPARAHGIGKPPPSHKIAQISRKEAQSGRFRPVPDPEPPESLHPCPINSETQRRLFLALFVPDLPDASSPRTRTRVLPRPLKVLPLQIYNLEYGSRDRLDSQPPLPPSSPDRKYQNPFPDQEPLDLPLPPSTNVDPQDASPRGPEDREPCPPAPTSMSLQTHLIDALHMGKIDFFEDDYVDISDPATPK